LLRAEKIESEEIKGAILCSVVPALTHNWEKVCSRSFGVCPRIVSSSTCAHLLNIDKTSFTELGADRVADAVAAKAIFGAPVIVVDFGTATNMEVIDKDGTFIGGVIAPGVESSMRSLFSKAALLSSVEIEDPGVSIGCNTGEAIQVGVVVGEAARVDGLIDRIHEQLGYTTKVVATGGLASRIAPLSRTITEVDVELTLQGLRLIYNDLNN
jgi:type III pantothenate kinase